MVKDKFEFIDFKVRDGLEPLADQMLADLRTHLPQEAKVNAVVKCIGGGFLFSAAVSVESSVFSSEFFVPNSKRFGHSRLWQALDIDILLNDVQNQISVWRRHRENN